MDRLLSLLDKYSKKIKLKKLTHYDIVTKNKAKLKHYVLKDEVDLQINLSIIRSLDNKEYLDMIYQGILNEQYHIYDNLDYKQRNVMIYQSLRQDLKQLNYFEEDCLILIGTLDKDINKSLIYDYQHYLLKRNKVVIDELITKQISPFDIYGYKAYHFTDFKYINHYGNFYYFYLVDSRCLFIYDSSSNSFVQKIYISDFKEHIDYCLDDIIMFVEYFNEKDIVKILDLLETKKYLCERYIKKIKKKLEKEGVI